MPSTIAAMEAQEVVTASEIGDYVYCKRGWWLRQQGLQTVPTPAMEKGIADHEALYAKMQALQIRRIIGWTFLVVGGCVMAGIILIQFL